MRCLVLIPTYNEAENIARLIPAVLAARADLSVLVIDDASPDGTGALVRGLRGGCADRLFLLERPGKGGLAGAYLAGFSWGLARDFDLFLEMDADFSHDPAYIPMLLSAAEAGNDVVIGSRNVPGGGVAGWSALRNLISKGGSWYSRAVLGCPIRDLTGGFNLWSRRALETMGLAGIISRGYSFQIEMKYRAWRNGLPWVELPILFTDRTRGQSKMSRAIFMEALFKVWRLRFLRQ